MPDEPRYKIDSRATCPPPSPEISAAVYRIADIMADAPRDAVGNRIMAVEALVKAMVSKGVPTLTARNAISWAWCKDCLRRNSRPGDYPEILEDTITLHQIGGGAYAHWLGPRPQHGTENTSQPETGDEMVTTAIVAKRFDLSPKQKDRLRKRLESWRSPTNCHEWTEVQERRPRQAQFLYRLGSIRPLIDAVKAG